MKKSMTSSILKNNQPGNTKTNQMLSSLRGQDEEIGEVQEQYISGMQDEIKLLEYQMKLLKDKETEEMTNFSHFFKFFNDGQPINEDIIAIKNQYSFTKKYLEEQIKELKLQNEKLRQRTKYLDFDCNKYIDQLKEQTQAVVSNDFKHGDELDKTRRKIHDIKNKTKDMERPIKNFNEESRKIQQKKHKLERDDQKEVQLAITVEKQRDLTLKKIKSEVAKQEKKLLELTLKSESGRMLEEDSKDKFKKEEEKEEKELDFAEYEDDFKFKLKLDSLEKENKRLQQKNLESETAKAQAVTKTSEYQYSLENFKRDRDKQWIIKCNLKAEITFYKDKMDLLNDKFERIVNGRNISYTQELVDEKIKELIQRKIIDTENITKKENEPMEERIGKLIEEMDKYTELICGFKSQKDDDEETARDIEEELKGFQDEYHNLKVDLLRNTEVQQQLNDDLMRIKGEMGELQEKIPTEEEIRIDAKALEQYRAQLALISEIKNFNFEEVKMITQSNKGVDKSINVLIDRWNMIRRGDYQDEEDLQNISKHEQI